VGRNSGRQGEWLRVDNEIWGFSPHKDIQAYSQPFGSHLVGEERGGRKRKAETSGITASD